MIMAVSMVVSQVVVVFIIVVFVMVVFVITHCRTMQNIVPHGATALETLIPNSLTIYKSKVPPHAG